MNDKRVSIYTAFPWLVDTTAAEFVLIWVAGSCGLFLIMHSGHTLTVIEVQFLKLAPLSIWSFGLGALAISHSAAIWGNAIWLRYLCTGFESWFFSYMLMALWLIKDPTPSRAHYAGLLLISFWILIRGPGKFHFKKAPETEDAAYSKSEPTGL